MAGNHGGQFVADCDRDEETLDLADALIANDGVIDLDEFRHLLRPRLQGRVTRSDDIRDHIGCLASELIYGDDAYRARRRRAQRTRMKAQRGTGSTIWNVIEGGKRDDDVAA